MRRSYLVLILCTLAITIILLLVACSKAGPKGATGPAGQQGTPGTQGAAGPAGSQIFEGNVVPAPTLGNVGDFYINEQSDSLYGPKTLSGWGNVIPLQGTAGAAGTPGAAGAAGSQILSGTISPTPNTGNRGDYYFDDLTDSLYGPKTSTGWGTAVSLRGAAGPQGPPGTANVIYYNWTAFSATNWGDFDPFNGTRDYNIQMPALTSGLLDQGVVLVYLELVDVYYGDTTEQLIDQLPTVFFNPFGISGTQKENLVAELSPRVLNFYLSDALDRSDPGTLYTQTTVYVSSPPLTIINSYLYRIVLIPGGVLGTSVDPHTLTYKQVCNKYGIQP